MVELPERHWGDETSTDRALLVHGLSSNRDSWWFVADELAAAGWYVTAVDLRGHGLAPKTPSYTLAEYAADLPGRGWDLVIGHSLGGAAALLAAQHEGFTDRLVLLDPVLDVPEEQYDEILAAQLAELDLSPDAMIEQRPSWHERDRAAKLAGIHQTDAFAVEHTFTDTGRWNVVEQAKAVGMPTLIIGADPAVYSMLATETVDAVTAATPFVEYTVVAGAGHSPHRDRPQQTMDALRAWLLRH